MYTIPLTLAAGANPITKRSKTGILSDPIAQFQQVKIQNTNASNAIFVGDETVTNSGGSNPGFKIAAGATETFTVFDYGEDLKRWFIAPTAANDTATILVIP